MNSLYVYILDALKGLLSANNIAKLVTSTLLKLGGLKAWIAKTIIKKVVDRFIEPKIEKKIDEIQDKPLTKQLQEEMAKDLKDIDWEKVDRLEREIFKARP